MAIQCRQEDGPSHRQGNYHYCKSGAYEGKGLLLLKSRGGGRGDLASGRRITITTICRGEGREGIIIATIQGCRKGDLASDRGIIMRY